jgi:protein subunit release factor B
MKKQEFIKFKEMSSKFVRESSFNDIIKNKELRNKIKESISDKQIFSKFIKESGLGGGLILTEA